MKHYLIEVTAECPVPRRFEYREEGSSIAVAVAKALRHLRKDLPRKRIVRLFVKAVPLGQFSVQS